MSNNVLIEDTDFKPLISLIETRLKNSVVFRVVQWLSVAYA